ncbi:hypothetical protein BJF79_48205 [Actinomadura sp. CNU-125]|nr:hypothetical protein BJF79_48205 [Actinomadura sp. CNU-125]
MTALVTPRCRTQTHRNTGPQRARTAAAPIQAIQPMCRLGMAAYGFAPADTTPVPQVAGGWCSAMTSTYPPPGSSRGGVTGHSAKHAIAMSVVQISVLRAHGYAGLRRHHR